eukprot:1669356-Amphidinium_carterae.2
MQPLICWLSAFSIEHSLCEWHLEKYVGLLQTQFDWNMASASSNTPLDPNEFDDPPAEHAERYAINIAPATGLTPRC